MAEKTHKNNKILAKYVRQAYLAENFHVSTCINLYSTKFYIFKMNDEGVFNEAIGKEKLLKKNFEAAKADEILGECKVLSKY